MSALRCPACGLVNYANSTACRRCGGALASGQGISTGGLAVEAPPQGVNPIAGYTPDQTLGPVTGGLRPVQTAPQPGGFNQPQSSSPDTNVAQPTQPYSPGPPPAGPLSGTIPAPDTFSQAPTSGPLGSVPPPPGGFGPAPYPGAFNQTQPSAPFYNVQPPEAAPYARTSYGAGAYPAPYARPMAAPANLRQGMAITSLILGCLSPFSCAVFGIGSIVGIVLGIVATVKAQRYPAQYGGKAMAIIGIGLNGFSMVVVVPIVLAIAIPNMLLSRMAANEASAIGTLRSIASAEAKYQSTIARGEEFGSLDQLISAGLVMRGTESKLGYKFEVRASEYRTRSGIDHRFEAYATPAVYGSTGRRSFYTDQQFVIRAADKGGRQAGNTDPAIQ
jgi:type IV pilus assembly protein PilA